MVDIDETAIITIRVASNDGLTLVLRNIYLFFELIGGGPELEGDTREYLPRDTGAIYDRVRVIGLLLDYIFLSRLVKITPMSKFPADTHTLLLGSYPTRILYKKPPMGLGHLPIPARLLAGYKLGVYLVPITFVILLVVYRANSVKRSSPACRLALSYILVNEYFTGAYPLGEILD